MLESWILDLIRSLIRNFIGFDHYSSIVLSLLLYKIKYIIYIQIYNNGKLCRKLYSLERVAVNFVRQLFRMFQMFQMCTTNSLLYTIGNYNIFSKF